MGPCVEPGVSPAKDLDLQPAFIEIKPVEVRDLQFPPLGRFEILGLVHNCAVVKVKPHDGVVRPWFFRLLLKGDYLPLVVELHNAVALGVSDRIAEYGCSLLAAYGFLEKARQALTVEKVVPKYEGARVTADELFPYQEGLGESAWFGLNRIGKVQAPLASVT